MVRRLLDRLARDPFAHAAIAQWALGVTWLVARFGDRLPPRTEPTLVSIEIRAVLSLVVGLALPVLAWWRARDATRLMAGGCALAALLLASSARTAIELGQAAWAWSCAALAAIAAGLLARAGWSRVSGPRPAPAPPP